MIYIFKIQFNLHTSGRLYIPGLERVIFETDKELTENQVETLKNKIDQFFTNKFGLNVEILLEQTTK